LDKPDEKALAPGNWGKHLDLQASKNHEPGAFHGAIWNVSFWDSA
jgi:hypothetical protein